MEENVKRYAGNYIILSLIIFVCFLYRMPVSFVGICSILALWDTFRVYINSRRLSMDSFRYRSLHLLGNIATMFVMVYCEVMVALAWAGVASFLVMILHSCLRRITSLKKSSNTMESSRSR